MVGLGGFGVDESAHLKKENPSRCQRAVNVEQGRLTSLSRCLLRSPGFANAFTIPDWERGTLSAGNADVALMQGAGWSPQRRGNTLATRWVTVGAGGRKNMEGDTLEGRFAT